MRIPKHARRAEKFLFSLRKKTLQVYKIRFLAFFRRCFNKAPNNRRTADKCCLSHSVRQSVFAGSARKYRIKSK